MGRTRGAGAGVGGEGDLQSPVSERASGRAMERRPQVRPRLRWVDNVRQDATSLGVRDWQISARDRGQ